MRLTPRGSTWRARRRDAGRTRRGGDGLKILLATSRWPFPPRRGDQVRALQTLELLGGAHEVTLVAPVSGAIVPLPCRVEGYEPAGWLRGFAGVVRAGMAGRPLQSGLFHSPDLARKLRALAPAHDLAILQLERLVGHFGDLGGVPVIVDLIDSLALNVERRAAFDRAILRPALRFEAARLLAAEGRLAERARKVLVVAERDRRFLCDRLSPQLAAKVEVLPLAIDEVPPPGAGERAEPGGGQEGAPTLAITGNLGYFPTADGALWFLAEVWPRLRAARPGVRLLLAGDRPAGLRAAAISPGVELIESPTDLHAILAGATLALAPMRAGSGLPVKILEAWSLGVPVLATPWAAAGTSGVPGEDFAVAEPRGDAWVETILRLIQNPAERARLAESARRRLAAGYSTEVVRARWLAAVG